MVLNIFLMPVAQYSLFMLKMPLNANKPNQSHHCTLSRMEVDLHGIGSFDTSSRSSCTLMNHQSSGRVHTKKVSLTIIVKYA